MWHLSNTLNARQKSSRSLAGLDGDVECQAVCVFIYFSLLLAQQDVALFGVAWCHRGWDRVGRRRLLALGQCLIWHVPLGSNVGARAVNGTVWLSAVVLVVIVKGSLRVSKSNVTRFTGCSSKEDSKGAVLGPFSHRFPKAPLKKKRSEWAEPTRSWWLG